MLAISDEPCSRVTVLAISPSEIFCIDAVCAAEVLVLDDSISILLLFKQIVKIVYIFTINPIYDFKIEFLDILIVQYVFNLVIC